MFSQHQYLKLDFKKWKNLLSSILLEERRLITVRVNKYNNFECYPHLNAAVAQVKVFLHVREPGAELSDVGQCLVSLHLHHVVVFPLVVRLKIGWV